MKRTTVKETFDLNTGELTKIEKSYSIKSKDEEAFFMVFDGSINGMIENSSTDISLMFILCSMIEYNESMVVLSPETRNRLMSDLKVGKQALSNSLSRLKKKKFIYGNRNDYTVNPFLFWRGTTNGRRAFIKKNSSKLNLMFK